MEAKKMKVVLTKVLLVFTIALTCIIIAPHEANASVIKGFNFQAGDIVVTKSTLAKGLTGHAGIVLPDGSNIVHIAGPNTHAVEISISRWLNDYPETKVVRPNDYFSGMGASYFGQNYFLNGAGKNIDYSILSGLSSKNKMYCSKLVWQCYDGAGINFKVMNVDSSGTRINYITPAILSPYSFVNARNLDHNGFKLVKSFNW